MGSNVATYGNRGGVLLGVNGIFAANTAAPGRNDQVVTNGSYASQGITGAFDSGSLLFQDCTGWAKWGVQVRPAVPGAAWTGLAATVYGCYDLDTADGTLTLGNANWFIMPAPSDQSGTGVPKNPLVQSGDFFYSNIPVVAVRIVVAISTGSVLFSIFAVP